MLPPVAVDTSKVTQKNDADRLTDAAHAAVRHRFGNNPHRAAVRIVRVVGIAIQHRQGDFGQFDAHAEKTNDPHPEYSAWATESDSERYATDIAQPNGRRKGGRQCLE